MAEPETKVYKRESGDGNGKNSIPVTVVATIVGALLSGGVSAKVTGGSAEAGMVRMEAQLEALRDDVRRQGESLHGVVLRLDARDKDLDERLRAVELHQARTSPPR